MAIDCFEETCVILSEEITKGRVKSFEVDVKRKTVRVEFKEDLTKRSDASGWTSKLPFEIRELCEHGMKNMHIKDGVGYCKECEVGQ